MTGESLCQQHGDARANLSPRCNTVVSFATNMGLDLNLREAESSPLSPLPLHAGILQEVLGKVTATRITVDTTVNQVL